MAGRKNLYRILLIVLSLVITISIIESIFRLKRYIDDKRNIEAWQTIGQQTAPSVAGDYIFRDIIRLSRERKIIYELIPNLSGTFLGQPLTTNAEGFRGPRCSKAKGRKTVRVVGLGDSVMFGWGVADHECYLARLSDDLNESFPEFSWEIVNTAVPGYNTVMEIETLKEKGLSYQPDLVVLDYVWNDQSLPNFIRKKANYFTLRKSFLIEFITSRLQGKDLLEKSPFINAPANPEGMIENDPDNVPEEYADLVGVDAFHRAFGELRSLSQDHHFLILVVSQGSLPEFVKKACSETGVPWVECGPAMKEYMLAHSITDQRKSGLVLSEGGYHPSALGHEIIAKVVLNYLRGSEFVRERVDMRSEP